MRTLRKPGGTKPSVVGVVKRDSSTVINTVVFVVLAVQTAATVLMMKYCRMQATSKSNADGNPGFATTSAVAIAEFMKMWVGIIVVSYDLFVTKQVHNPWRVFLNTLVGNNLTDFFKMAVPATVYALQNNLLFIALSHLDSAIYQVCYQFKTFMAAIFAIVLLGRSYTTLQWLSFAMLTAGAILANLSVVSTTTNSSSLHKPSIDSESNSGIAKVASVLGIQESSLDTVIGVSCVFSATVTSGFAGVFTEKQLKGSTASLWVKNVQLGLFGCLATLLNSWLFGDWQTVIAKYGFLHGFTADVWIVVALNTLGGYLVATLMKYASNQAKAFAGGCAIVLVVLGSKMFFGSEFTPVFWLGLVLVISANLLYNRESQKGRK